MADEKPKWLLEAQAKRAEAMKWVKLGRVEGLLEAARVAESYEPRCDSCPRGVASAIRARIPKDVQIHECGAKDITDEPSE